MQAFIETCCVLEKGETLEGRRIRLYATDDLIRRFRLRLSWKKFSLNIGQLRRDRKAQFAREKKAKDRVLLLEQLNE